MQYVPLLFVPFALYNVFAIIIFPDAQAGFAHASLFTVLMVSGATFTLTPPGPTLTSTRPSRGPRASIDWACVVTARVETQPATKIVYKIRITNFLCPYELPQVVPKQV